MTAGVTLSVVWKVLFAGDEFGYLNNFLLTIGAIDAPIQWLQSPQYILPIMIIASLWSSMGVGFLSMMAGVLNIDAEIYEAGYIDGVRNRFQEILYITVPSMKPQMLFGAVMAMGYATALSVLLLLLILLVSQLANKFFAERD